MLRRRGLSVSPRFLWECLTSRTVSPFPAVLPPLSVGKMTLRLYSALNYSHGLSKGTYTVRLTETVSPGVLIIQLERAESSPIYM